MLSTSLEYVSVVCFILGFSSALVRADVEKKRDLCRVGERLIELVSVVPDHRFQSIDDKVLPSCRDLYQADQPLV